MTAQSVTRQEEIQAIRKQYPGLYSVAVGLIVLITGFLLGGIWFRGDDNGLSYTTNLYTEIISIGITIVVLDRINEYRDKQRLKKSLVREAGSSSNETAKSAVDWIRYEKWLCGDEGVLKGANLQYANLKGAHLRNSNLENANLVGAILQETDLTDAKLTKACLDSGCLEDTLLYNYNANLVEASLELAILNGADLTYANMARVHLESADLIGTILSEVNLMEANLSDTNLQSASLGMSNLEKVQLDGANLTKAYLSLANLEGATLFHSNLVGAELDLANLTGTHLGGANLTGAILYRANLLNVGWSMKFDDSTLVAILPDGTKWTPDTDIDKFANPEHPEYEATLIKINAIREEMGLKKLDNDKFV